MDVFWIVPELDIEVVKTLDKHMIIGPWLESELYRDAYLHATGAKILDNGFHEGKVISTEELRSWAEVLKVKYVVGPDTHGAKPFDETVEDFIDEIPSKFEIILPIHNYKEPDIYIDLCEEYGLIPGLPKRPQHGPSTILDRIRMVKMLADIFPHVHLLGLDLSLELAFLKDTPIYITLDTSLPYKYANAKFDFYAAYDTDYAHNLRQAITSYIINGSL